MLPAVEADARIADAIRVMREYGLYHVLVTSGERVEGILSVVDAARSFMEKLEAAGDVERVDAVRRFFEERVSRLATRPVIVVEEGVSMRDAARIMHSHRIGCLPVVKDDVVTRAICEPDVVRALVEEGRRDPVYRHATRRLVYVEYEATIMEALGVIVEGGFRRLPVLARGALAGITTVHMLMEALVANPKMLYEQVGRVMKPAVTVDLWTPVYKAAEEVLRSNVGAVILVEGGTLAGIFTERDAVRVYAG
ncbi:putative signal transduction protein with CBS domains [Pyrolobus fumarii 1A]|uniref:Putative signal transduction protein with CBS domains n=1 Tax=Pyrolobus fumarii (strain DSM 11204 / 1A) TaxID=694429 RepID=G0EGY6_PYRF1|nr:CBS domain-containing protein [Pyrolobus fumarii]AEM38436.1 putative signal transduction protein with CBS domains [Pyrolobus fumarii 1A]